MLVVEIPNSAKSENGNLGDMYRQEGVWTIDIFMLQPTLATLHFALGAEFEAKAYSTAHDLKFCGCREFLRFSTKLYARRYSDDACFDSYPAFVLNRT